MMARIQYAFVAITAFLSVHECAPSKRVQDNEIDTGVQTATSARLAMIRRTPIKDYNDLIELKNVDLAYGTKLSSLEESPQTLKLELKDPGLLAALEKKDAPQKTFLSQGSGLQAASKRTTRCTTDQRIVLDPNFAMSSSDEYKGENLKEDEEKDKQDKRVSKKYDGPPMAKNPDHYIDDA